MKKAALKKLAEFLIDVAKYVLTVAIVISFLGEFGEKKIIYYSIGAFFVVICLVFGFLIINKLDSDENEKT